MERRFATWPVLGSLLMVAAAAPADLRAVRQTVPASPAWATRDLRAGIIGTDTHVPAFTAMFNRTHPEWRIKVVAAFKGGSPDLPTSADRLEGFAKTIRDEHGVELVDSIAALLSKVDVVLLESVDGRPHLAQATPVLKAHKRVFIDKPLAASLDDVRQIVQLSKETGTPFFSTSSYRFYPDVVRLGRDPGVGTITRVQASSPFNKLAFHPDLFYYGIHGIEALYAVMGTGCVRVTRKVERDADITTCTWTDGRIGSYYGPLLSEAGRARGAAPPNPQPVLRISGERGTVDGGGQGYDGLERAIAEFFHTGRPPVDPAETVELFEFMTAAQLSMERGGAPVALASLRQAPLAPHQQLAHDIYKELININTGPTKGTTVAAQAVAKRLHDAGFADGDIFVGGPRDDKHNIVVRYRGKGGATAPKPLLLLAHLDVVEALKSDWSPDLDPFVFTERDGYYYGRGTSDDKAMASIFVANLIRLKQESFVPTRDIIVALTADEEGGGSNGAAWLVANRRELVDAAYVVNEGGGGVLRNDKPFWNAVQATEKISTTFTVTATNRGGHSSVPRPDNAIYQLAASLTRLAQLAFPVQLNDVTRAFFTKTAAIETPDMGAAMRAIVASQSDAAAAATISRDPRYNSMLRTTCVATMLEGGHATNALPQTAKATVNCRILPNVDPATVRDGIVRALNDPGLEVSAAPALNSTQPSPLLPEFFEPVEGITKVLFGDISVIPIMGTGATDSRSFRRVGIPSYGVSGLFGDPADNRAHGRDERMRIQSYYDGQEFLYRLTKTLAGR